jgi:molybdenum cofactor guanylyltransferase
MIGIVLAGGKASRLGGGDKGALSLAGTTVLERVLTALRPQCDTLLFNAPADRPVPQWCTLVPDAVPGQPGPLAGLLAGLDHVAAHHPRARFAVTVPTDVPFLPGDLVARLQDQAVADGALAVCARSGDRTHHVVALWAVDLRHDIRRVLVEDGCRKVSVVLARHPTSTVAWPTTPFDPFFNINTPENLARAEQIAQAPVP